jgi:hypothetical protein
MQQGKSKIYRNWILLLGWMLLDVPNALGADEESEIDDIDLLNMRVETVVTGMLAQQGLKDMP